MDHFGVVVSGGVIGTEETEEETFVLGSHWASSPSSSSSTYENDDYFVKKKI